MSRLRTNESEILFIFYILKLLHLNTMVDKVVHNTLGFFHGYEVILNSVSVI